MSRKILWMMVLSVVTLAVATGCKPRDAKKNALGLLPAPPPAATATFTSTPSATPTPSVTSSPTLPPAATPTVTPTWDGTCLDNYMGSLALGSSGITVTGTTAGSNNYYTYNWSAAPDKVYQIQVPYAGTWLFTLCGSSYDTTLRLVTTCMGDGGSSSYQLAANDDYCGLQSGFSYGFGASGTYYIVVDGWGSGSGSYMLAIHYQGS